MTQSYEHLQYESVSDALLNEFPELRPAYERLNEDWRRKPPGQYIVIEGIFYQYVTELLVRDVGSLQGVLLQQSFDFVDGLLKSKDRTVANLAYIGVLEWRPGWWYARAQVYIGELASAELDEFYPAWRQLAEQTGKHVPSNDLNLLRSTDIYRVGSIVDQLLKGTSLQ